ncbi:MAG: transporter [Hyphomicrobiaceae bacterium]
MRGGWLGQLAAGAVVALAAVGTAGAQDKSQYTLLNPTPDHLLRDMTTDRPDITETPFSIDAGHVQIETTVLGFARSRADGLGAITDTYELAVTNVRIGLTHNLEAGFVWQPYGVVRIHGGPGGDTRLSGIGGLELRGKINLWGNDTFGKPGSSALGLLPFVVLPTDRHNGISPDFAEAGLIVPYALKLTDKLSLGINAGIAWVKGDASAGYHAESMASASLGVEWSDKLGTFYEVAGRFHADGGDEVVLGTGVTYRLSKNVQLDAGANFGITSAADRFNPFIGMAVRF